jgi:hypothetical protein
LKGLTTTENAPGVDADQSTGSLGSAGGASPRCPTPGKCIVGTGMARPYPATYANNHLGPFLICPHGI